MEYITDPHPWTDGRGWNLSIVDLVLNETIPVAPAAMLWWALERGASLLTAAGPSGAGKSTLANACLCFLPDGARAYAVTGADDPMDLPIEGGPTYLLVNELSNHGRPAYIAGPAARRALARVRAGHRLVGTLHADSVDQAIQVLRNQVGLSLEDIAQVELIAVVRVEGLVTPPNQRPSQAELTAPSVRRRIVEIGLLAPDPLQGIRKTTLAAVSEESGRLEIDRSPSGFAALAEWAGIPTSSAELAVAERAEVLAHLAAEGRRDPRDIADAVRRARGGKLGKLR